MGIYDFTVYDVIKRNALLFQKKMAWQDAESGLSLSFGDFKTNVDRLAQGLLRAGVKKGDRIGVVGKNCLHYFLLYGAAAAVGGIVVPINWRLSPEEAAYNLNDTGTHIVVADADDDAWMTAMQTRLAEETVFYNLQPAQGPFREFDLSAAPAALPEVNTEDGLVIIHTAAVAGRPRGALLSHGNLLCANMHLMYCFGMTSLDVHLNLLPLFHVAGLGTALQSFHAGALNINMRKFDAPQAVRLIAERRVSLLFDFAPILKSILDEQEKVNADLHSLRAVMGLDAPETIERFQKVTGGTFYCLYGQTETSMLVSMGPYNDCPGAAGRPLPLAGVGLVDETGRTVDPGEVGEIVVQGPMVFKGYWNLPIDNADCFRNARHHTGDLGRLDADGYLWYAGRKPEKELIKPGGENVYPAEVENAILEHPAIDAVVVFGIPDAKWKEGIKAVCTLKAGQRCTSQELIAFVGDRIARYKKPQYVTFIDQMPVTPSGGIDRTKIKQLHGGC
jgi:acyl-CoA synthetase (AMP-forming)/AMP-acid ligase II